MPLSAPWPTPWPRNPRTYPGMEIDEGMRNSSFRLESGQHPFAELSRLIPEHHVPGESVTRQQASHETNVRLEEGYFRVLEKKEQEYGFINAGLTLLRREKGLIRLAGCQIWKRSDERAGLILFVFAASISAFLVFFDFARFNANLD